MSKRPWQGEEEGKASCRHRSGTKQKSLYLVLDDWYMGFTIRKLDADSPDMSAPPILRLVSPTPNHNMDFAALGSNIIAIGNQHTSTLVFDTEIGSLAMGNPLPDALINAANFFVAAGDDDVLIAFAYYFMQQPHSFEVMTTNKHEFRSLCPSTDWSWESMPTPPFTERQQIRSYALHPDGRTLFVSVYSDMVSGTFSFDTKSRVWSHHGEWMLPFELQGYFDVDLDAWVGLHPDGYICSCQVPSLGSSNLQQPDWKMAKEHKMWTPTHKVASAQGATLTYMGNSRFFIVDCKLADGLDVQNGFGGNEGCMLYMTTFRLKYNHEGKLRIMDKNTTTCAVSRQIPCFSPVAFWM